MPASALAPGQRAAQPPGWNRTPWFSSVASSVAASSDRERRPGVRRAFQQIERPSRCVAGDEPDAPALQPSCRGRAWTSRSARDGIYAIEAKADRTFWGRVVESAVGAHLFNTATSDVRLHYWRESPHEVDFGLQRGPRLVAVEVKSGPRRGPLRGLETFAERFRPRRSLLVGEGGVPLPEFLAAPAGAWFEEGP